MLTELDLSLKMEKDKYKKIYPDLAIQLGQLQRECREKGIAHLVIFEGMSASGKGTLINRLIQPLDPRGFTVYTIKPPNEEESMRPYLWRFWIKIPPAGRMAVLDRSWYQRLWVERVERKLSPHLIRQAIQEINSFEKQLADAGIILIKFWLQIDKKEQKKRFKALESLPETKWRVTEQDWQRNKDYSKYLKVAEEMLQETDTGYAPWNVIEAVDERWASIKIIQKTAGYWKASLLNSAKAKPAGKSKISLPGKEKKQTTAESSLLSRADLSLKLKEEEYREKLSQYQKEFREIEYDLYRKRIPMLIAFEGWDAAGKGGNIRRLTYELDPRGYEVVPISAPTELEKARPYLWRFWVRMPKAGHIAIFDRTWYGRVLVERVEGFCTEEEWNRAYWEIREMEQQLASFGTIIAKFWLHISKEEQLRRFKSREADPAKQWKITPEDWRNREKWELYRQAVDEMLLRTSTTYAPWTVVEANDKYYARVKVLKTVIEAAKKVL
jgi:polyphosphate kinase 2 (PPK2 family)